MAFEKHSIEGRIGLGAAAACSVALLGLVKTVWDGSHYKEDGINWGFKQSKKADSYSLPKEHFKVPVISLRPDRRRRTTES